jgi:hypothetical protein
VTRYKPEILHELARHGLKPRPDTPPDLLRRVIHDLYLFEIRALRDRCREGEFPTQELAGHVVELRKRYMLLSVPLEAWTEI